MSANLPCGLNLCGTICCCRCLQSGPWEAGTGYSHGQSSYNPQQRRQQEERLKWKQEVSRETVGIFDALGALLHWQGQWCSGPKQEYTQALELLQASALPSILDGMLRAPELELFQDIPLHEAVLRLLQKLSSGCPGLKPLFLKAPGASTGLLELLLEQVRPVQEVHSLYLKLMSCLLLPPFSQASAADAFLEMEGAGKKEGSATSESKTAATAPTLTERREAMKSRITQLKEQLYAKVVKTLNASSPGTELPAAAPTIRRQDSGPKEKEIAFMMEVKAVAEEVKTVVESCESASKEGRAKKGDTGESKDGRCNSSLSALASFQSCLQKRKMQMLNHQNQCMFRSCSLLSSAKGTCCQEGASITTTL